MNRHRLIAIGSFGGLGLLLCISLLRLVDFSPSLGIAVTAERQLVTFEFHDSRFLCNDRIASEWIDIYKSTVSVGSRICTAEPLPPSPRWRYGESSASSCEPLQVGVLYIALAGAPELKGGLRFRLQPDGHVWSEGM